MTLHQWVGRYQQFEATTLPHGVRICVQIYVVSYLRRIIFLDHPSGL